MKKSEKDIFLKQLPEYIKHYEKNPNSLLAKIFGVFEINKRGTGDIYVMLMENTL